MSLCKCHVLEHIGECSLRLYLCATEWSDYLSQMSQNHEKQPHDCITPSYFLVVLFFSWICKFTDHVSLFWCTATYHVQWFEEYLKGSHSHSSKQVYSLHRLTCRVQQESFSLSRSEIVRVWKILKNQSRFGQAAQLFKFLVGLKVVNITILLLYVQPSEK